MSPTIGQVFWIFGLSGAGKSTLATALIGELRSQQIPVLALDGDVLRNGLCNDLDFSDNQRTENLRRAAEVARLGSDSGLCVVASFITPFESQRRLIREIVGDDRISMIFTDAPLEVCRQRDVKGIYARAQVGEIPRMTGISSTFESPANADLHLPTAAVSPTDSIRVLVNHVMSRLGQTEQFRAGKQSA